MSNDESPINRQKDFDENKNDESKKEKKPVN